MGDANPNLFDKADVEPVICDVDNAEAYLRQRNVALCVFALPKNEPADKLRQLSSLIRFYKLECELLCVHEEDEQQVLRAMQDCSAKFIAKKSSESPELIELLKQIIAKRTGSGYFTDKVEALARVEVKMANMQERLGELIAELANLNDCLFGGPNHPGWDRRLDWLEEQNKQIKEFLAKLQTEQAKELVIFKNQIGALVVRSVAKFLVFNTWTWICENPMKMVGLIGAIAGLILALFNL